MRNLTLKLITSPLSLTAFTFKIDNGLVELFTSSKEKYSVPSKPKDSKVSPSKNYVGITPIPIKLLLWILS